MIDAFKAVLKQAVALKSSDVHVCAGGPFRLRIRGELLAVEGAPSLSPADTTAIAAEIAAAARKATPAALPEYLRT
ncbi:MAG: hypothetical protein ACREL5_12755, partial [Gemmatimonadales bacterium]